MCASPGRKANTALGSMMSVCNAVRRNLRCDLQVHAHQWRTQSCPSPPAYFELLHQRTVCLNLAGEMRAFRVVFHGLTLNTLQQCIPFIWKVLTRFWIVQSKKYWLKYSISLSRWVKEPNVHFLASVRHEGNTLSFSRLEAPLISADSRSFATDFTSLMKA